MLLFLYAIPLVSLSIYSYALIDPNLTLLQTNWWVIFRDKMVYFGYYQRDHSWLVYLILVAALFFFHYVFLKKYKQVNPIHLAILIGIITIFSYPFLTHDFFNYLFDAKIVTFYHQNPYFHKALDFPYDPWLRFMQWTHRTYPYGPTFLPITLLPSFLSMGKFMISFLFFKITFFFFYFLAVLSLSKLNKKWAVLFATNPLIIVEGLINSHNDLIALSLAIVGVYFLFKKKDNKARLLLVISAGIKYLTLPLFFLSRDNKKLNRLVFFSLLALVTYLSIKSEIQPWYFLAVFAFIPFYERLINHFAIFFAGLLLSYYPYIRLGGWDSADKVNLKHLIIIWLSLFNMIYIFFSRKKLNLK